jgi:PAS domain S-box-containing protein
MARLLPEGERAGRRASGEAKDLDDERPDRTLQEVPDRYFTLFAASPVPFLRLDPNGLILEVNNAASVLFTTASTSLVGHPLIVFVVPEDRSQLLEHLRLARNRETLLETEPSLLCSQRAVHVRMRTVPISPGRRKETWAFLEDLTDHQVLQKDRQRAERLRAVAERDEQEARASSLAKTRFLATLSHELRTPLTPALFAAARLRETAPDPTVREAAEVIRRNIENEARLIDDLLDLAQIGRGGLNLRCVPLDLHPIIAEAVSVCQPHARARNVRIEVSLDAEAHHVLGDASRLRQVFWNVLINAIKSTEGGRVEVDTRNTEHGDVRVRITDTGIGMDEETLATLFLPFEQRPPSATGLGLGLAICKGIVDAHNGQVWARSPGRGWGSTFEVDLPVAEVAAQVRSAREPAAADRPSASPRSRRILLVEDDADSSETLKLILAGEGHTVEVATTVAEALAKSAKPWDVVISDVALPDGTGLEVARRFRDASPPVRLIAMSGYGSPEDVRATCDAGFQFHLVKPVDIDMLRRLLKGEEKRS